MTTRRSVRRFKAERPRKAAIERLIDAAVTAPSASNKQPWRFCVLADRALIERLCSDVQARLDEVLARLPAGLARSEVQAYGRYFVRFVDAPVVIVPMFRPLAVLSHLLADAPGVDAATSPPERAADAAPAAAADLGTGGAELPARVATMELHSGLVSTSLAVQNLLLAAHAQGLGASCMSGPLLAAPEIEQALALGGQWQAACLIALGYPDEEPVAPARKSAASVTRWYGTLPEERDGAPA